MGHRQYTITLLVCVWGNLDVCCNCLCLRWTLWSKTDVFSENKLVINAASESLEAPEGNCPWSSFFFNEFYLRLRHGPLKNEGGQQKGQQWFTVWCRSQTKLLMLITHFKHSYNGVKETFIGWNIHWFMPKCAYFIPKTWFWIFVARAAPARDHVCQCGATLWGVTCQSRFQQSSKIRAANVPSVLTIMRKAS